MSSTLIVSDMMKRRVEIPERSLRIVSLVPSQTELLFDLGLDEEIVGLTKFCIHPREKTGQKTRIGGTKNFDIDTIKALQPDLIIGNKEENYQEGIEALETLFPVWMSDINEMEDALEAIKQIGQITGKCSAAQKIVEELETKRKAYQEKNKGKLSKKVAYLIWARPFMAAGGQTFIDAMLKEAGFENCLTRRPRYPEVDWEELTTLKPDCVFLSSEPYPFKEKHRQEFEARLPGSKVILVDGEMFSWYGSRLLKSYAYFEEFRKKLSANN